MKSSSIKDQIHKSCKQSIGSIEVNGLLKRKHSLAEKHVVVKNEEDTPWKADNIGAPFLTNKPLFVSEKWKLEPLRSEHITRKHEIIGSEKTDAIAHNDVWGNETRTMTHEKPTLISELSARFEKPIIDKEIEKGMEDNGKSFNDPKLRCSVQIPSSTYMDVSHYESNLGHNQDIFDDNAITLKGHPPPPPYGDDFISRIDSKPLSLTKSRVVSSYDSKFELNKNQGVPSIIDLKGRPPLPPTTDSSGVFTKKRSMSLYQPDIKRASNNSSTRMKNLNLNSVSYDNSNNSIQLYI